MGFINKAFMKLQEESTAISDIPDEEEEVITLPPEEVLSFDKIVVIIPRIRHII